MFAFFTPSDPALIFTLAVAVVGMIAASSSASSSFLPSFFAFSYPSALPLVVVCFLNPDSLTLTIASFMLLYLIIATLVTVSFAKDHTELIRLRLEKQLFADSLQEEKDLAEKAVKDKNRFLAAASHDLRQPLHAATMLVGAMRTADDPSERKTILHKLDRALASLSTAFNGLLDMSKLEAGVVSVNTIPLQLDKLIRLLIKELEKEVTDKGLQISITGDSYVWAASDPIHLQRILRNLLINAVQYTPSGEIVVEIESQQKNIVCTVRDTGVGIENDEQEKIFSEYYQIQNPERDPNKGMGLGLSIVKRLVNLLGHELRLESAVDQGSRFSLVLPRCEATPDTTESAQILIDEELKSHSIMIVDDNDSVRESTAVLLRSWGHRTELADSLESALAILDRDQLCPSLFLIDYRLRNNVTGVEVYQAISEHFGTEIPVIIITGDTSSERLNTLKQSGYWVLHKPIKPLTLRTAIQQALS